MKKRVAAQPEVVWERPERAPRPAPVPLRREQIVAAAMGLADREGLEAVSLRNVAAALGAGPMRLYGFVATKDELLELMVDEVFGELLAEGPLPKRGWRKLLREAAQRLVRASVAHVWFVELLAGRHHVGPHALQYLDACLASLSRERGFTDIDTGILAMRVLTAYVVGALQTQAGELRAARRSGLSEAEWKERHYPYLQRLLATGTLPMIARLVEESKDYSADVEFERGLECVLDGIAARTK